MSIKESTKTTNPPAFKNSGDLQYIIDFFGSDNLVFCGSLADFYWLNWLGVSDFDMEISEKHLLHCFGMSAVESKILKNGFGLYLSKTRLFPKFYHGLFHKSKLDLFLKDYQVSGEKVDGSKFNVKGEVQIDSPAIRVSMLKALLKFTSKNYQNHWMKEKNQEAKEKLVLYRETFPEIFKIKKAIRR
jgi:hypothetical protein